MEKRRVYTSHWVDRILLTDEEAARLGDMELAPPRYYLTAPTWPEALLVRTQRQHHLLKHPEYVATAHGVDYIVGYGDTPQEAAEDLAYNVGHEYHEAVTVTGE